MLENSWQYKLQLTRNRVFVLHAYVLILAGFLTLIFTIYTQDSFIQSLNTLKGLFTLTVGVFNYWAIKTNRVHLVIWSILCWSIPILYETFFIVDPSGFSVIKSMGFITFLQLLSIEYKPILAFKSLGFLLGIYTIKWYLITYNLIEVQYVFQNGYMEYSLLLISIIFMGIVTTKFESGIRESIHQLHRSKNLVKKNIHLLEERQNHIEKNFEKLNDITNNEIKELRAILKGRKDSLNLDDSKKLLNDLDHVIVTVNEKIEGLKV